MAKQTWKKGDTVFAINPWGKLIETTIKAVHRKEPLPYELDLKTPMRFYSADSLFETKDEAVSANLKSTCQQFHEAQESGKPFIGEQDADYDEKTHTFLNAEGKRVSEFFTMTKRQEAEYNQLISQLIAFCEKHALPFFAVLGTYNKKSGDWGICHSSMLPSVRTPPIFDAIEALVQHFMEEEP
jgi:hypothetical protein